MIGVAADRRDRPGDNAGGPAYYRVACVMGNIENSHDKRSLNSERSSKKSIVLSLASIFGVGPGNFGRG